MDSDARPDDARPDGRGSMFREILTGYSQDRGALMAAALAFYALLSIAPVLLLAVAIAGLVYGEDTARAQVVFALETELGPAAAAVVSALLEGVSDRGEGLVATVISGAAILYAASRLFVQLQAALNQIWNVTPRPARHLRGAVVGVVAKRLVSFVLIVLIGLLLVALILSEASLRAAELRFGQALPASEVLFRAASFLVSIGLATVLFAVVFKVLPDVRIAWRDVWRGAFVSAVLFALGKLLIGLWLAHVSVGSVYGAAGSFFVLMLWLYYSSQVFFFGAELTQVWARRHGGGLEPSRHAVRVRRGPLSRPGDPEPAR